MEQGPPLMAQSGRGEIHEICWRFGASRGPGMKFGPAITETEVKSAKLSPTCANDLSHPRTCRYKLIAALLTVNTAHFTFGDQIHTYILY